VVTAKRSTVVQAAGIVALALVLSDSLITYFVKQFIAFFPVNTLLLIVVLAAALHWGSKIVLPPPNVLFALLMAIVAFVSGIVIVPEIKVYRFFEIGGALCAFLVGYFSLRWANDEKNVARLFLVIPWLYIIVCTIALMKIMPSFFPLKEKLWSLHGDLVARPEIVTDQNFQVYYFVPIVLALALTTKLLRFTLAFLGVIGGLFVLVKLQTRSGILVFLGCVCLSLLASLWTRELGRRKIIFLPILIGILVAVWLPEIMDIGSIAIARFFSTDYSTGYGRLEANLYLFRHVYDPAWWLPRGYSDFVAKYGNTPHSNATAMFLEGGIIGLISWVSIFLLPLIRLTTLYFKKKLDMLETLILMGGVSSLVLQLSLIIPLFEQAWLWAGAVTGVLLRARERNFKVADSVGQARLTIIPKAGKSRINHWHKQR